MKTESLTIYARNTEKKLGPGIRGKFLEAYRAGALIIPIEQVTEDNLHEEVDTGDTSGNEAL